MDAVWDGRLDGSMDKVYDIVVFGDWSTRRGNFGVNVGHPIVTRGVCGVYSCTKVRERRGLFLNYILANLVYFIYIADHPLILSMAR